VVGQFRLAAEFDAARLGAFASWSSGGRDYERISKMSADAIGHVVQRIMPQPGEWILDVATGTGWTARLIAASGAQVTGIDIGDGVIEAARALAPAIDATLHAAASRQPATFTLRMGPRFPDRRHRSPAVRGCQLRRGNFDLRRHVRRRAAKSGAGVGAGMQERRASRAGDMAA
jgi:SAM-dependent methyltransferase